MSNELSSLGVESPDGSLRRERSIVGRSGQSTDRSTRSDGAQDIAPKDIRKDGVEESTVVVTGKRGGNASQGTERTLSVREEVLREGNVEQTTVGPVADTEMQEAHD